MSEPTMTGMQGDAARHLSQTALIEGLRALPAPPRDEGTVDLLIARGPNGERHLPQEAVLTVDGGMPGDRWVNDDKYDERYQIAVTRTDTARLIANGQPLEMHGDNVYLSLDLSADNLPEGTTLRLGEALMVVTPKAHNGCKKWVQRFGMHPMQLNLHPDWAHWNLRGVYFRVLEPGRVRVGDTVKVLERPA